jgi:hypothetical protein
LSALTGVLAIFWPPDTMKIGFFIITALLIWTDSYSFHLNRKFLKLNIDSDNTRPITGLLLFPTPVKSHKRIKIEIVIAVVFLMVFSLSFGYIVNWINSSFSLKELEISNSDNLLNALLILAGFLPSLVYIHLFDPNNWYINPRIRKAFNVPEPDFINSRYPLKVPGKITTILTIYQIVLIVVIFGLFRDYYQLSTFGLVMLSFLIFYEHNASKQNKKFFLIKEEQIQKSLAESINEKI